MTPRAPPAREMRRFARRDDRRAFGAVALDWVIVIVAAGVADRVGGWIAWFAAAVVIAGRQTAMLNLTHAASHGSLFERPRWNEALEVLYALPIGDTVARYRVPHAEHHLEHQAEHPDRFSFLHEELGLLGSGPLRRTWIVFVRPTLGHAGFDWLRGTLRAMRNDAAYRAKLLVFWVPLVGVAALGGSLGPLLLYWVIPLVWLSPVFLLWGEVADHFQAEGGTRDHLGLFHAALTNGHALYHDVHHRYAFIPFYCEPAAHAHLVELGLAARSPSRSVIDFLRGLYGPAPVTSSETPG